jgi:hypothetical protein
MKNTILGERHYLLYTVVTAIRPRMLITLDENLKPLTVSVRVGQAVDTVGQAGSPKTITGFQVIFPFLWGFPAQIGNRRIRRRYFLDIMNGPSWRPMNISPCRPSWKDSSSSRRILTLLFLPWKRNKLNLQNCTMSNCISSLHFAPVKNSNKNSRITEFQPPKIHILER